MGTTWSYEAAAYLTTYSACPRCDELLDTGTRCRRCGADLSGQQAREVVAASQRAADAIRQRQELINLLPTIPSVATPARMAALPRPGIAAARTSQSQLSVQSVLAVAGAGLVAVAAFVFTFLNPELTDFATRSLVVAAITAVFLGGAWLLARMGLQFSAESVGALGVVFLILDVWAFASSTPPGINDFVFAGIGTVAASGLLFAIAIMARIRSWLWAALIGLSLSPALFGYSIDSPWGPILGHLAVGGLALLVHGTATRLSTRFSSPLRTERVTAAVLQLLVVAVVLLQLLPLVALDAGTLNVLPSAAAVAGLALLAAASIRYQLPRFWTFGTGVLTAGTAAVASLAVPFGESPLVIAIVPAAVAVATVAIAAAPRFADRDIMVFGAWAVLLIAGIPSLMSGALQFVTATIAVIPIDWGLAAILGIAVVAVGSLFARVLMDAAAPASAPRQLPLLAVWFGAATLLAAASWSGWLPVTQLSLALALAVGLTLLLARVAPVRTAHAVLRAAPALAAHLLVIFAAVVSWTDPTLTVWAGVAVVAAVLVVARAVWAGVRHLHTGVAFAYALVVLAKALDLTVLDDFAVLCLVTAVASVGGFVATMTRRLAVRHWYAILIVTAIPFMVGVGSVLVERNGWTAISTAVAFALAASLVVTVRPGLTIALRAVAASLLVPSLAVVATCLASTLPESGSPVALPAIAAIVAITLPLSGRLQTWLERRGISARDARIARIWLEASTLLTGALAVLLALVRSAAGLGTSFLVLVIIGLGAAATGLFAGRRYAWVVAAASFTGALWSLLALAEVTVVEPYLLPPSIAAILIGAIAVARGVPGLGFFVTGLGGGIIPTLVLLAMGDGPGTPWRAAGLLVASALLIALAVVFTRFERLRSLRIATLIAAIVAAAAGSVQAVRWGWALDVLASEHTNSDHADWVMISAVGVSLAAAALAAIAATVATRVSPRLAASRMLYVPAFLYLAVGPMAAIERAWLPIFTLLGLSIVLLAIMLGTAVAARRGPVTLPPVWLQFALAWSVAVAGWSPRELRVEAFSLPLGIFLLAAGVVLLRPVLPTPARGGLTSWPAGFAGSWRLLTPGLVVIFLPSMLATMTDPRTERAVLVIALALAAVLLGSLFRQAAPFILGIVVLPIENVLVFAVQIGREIESAPWWITLATAGATLLVIAVTSERRGRVAGVGARLRDLT